jgi:hypothetical protein
VFAPVDRMSTVRLFFSMVASHDLECHQIDIKNAFVQGDLEEEIYMQQPPWFDDGTGSVLTLNKSLYGLKQAPRVWHQTLTAHLFDLGCVQSQSDDALFIYTSNEHEPFYLLLYVDDIRIASKQFSTVEAIKSSLLDKFSGRDLGATKFFLQMSVERDRESRLLVLRQQRHVEKLANVANLNDAWTVRVPIITGLYRDALGDAVTDPTIVTQYKSLLSTLMHLANYTRPDVAFSVSYLARFVNAPTTREWQAKFSIICLLAYL